MGTIKAPDEKQLVIAGLYSLLSELAYSLAMNKMPAQEVMEVTQELSAWWEARSGKQFLDEANQAPLIAEVVRKPHVQAVLKSFGNRLRFTYTNYKGVTSVRTISPKGLEVVQNSIYLEPTWCIRATCEDKKEERSFSQRHPPGHH